MRWTRPLILLAILAILGAVGATYYGRLQEQRSKAPGKPNPLPPGIDSSAQDWTYTKMVGDKAVAFVKAKDFKEVNGKFELKGLELHIFHKDGSQYDLVKSDRGDFQMSEGILYSDGDVEITLGVPADKPPSGRLMKIKSSGVRFESKTSKASTDRHASFEFDQGEGKAVGADYDPQARELHMKSHVSLTWRGKNPKAAPMNVETGDLVYKERESKVFLSPASKLTRGTLTLNSGPGIVTLAEGAIQQVEALNADGTDQRPGRSVAYAAESLVMHFNDDGQVNKIVGERNARLVSTADTAQTTVTADKVDLDFNTADGDSTLETALATGHSVLESKPVPKAGVETADTRILRSEIVKTKMRPGGQEIDNVETLTPGSLEFVPNRPVQPHRWMNGEHLWITYGPNNQIQTFKSVNVSTRTENPTPKDAKQPPAPVLTWSKDMLAEFTPKTSNLAKLEQWNNFRYEEGDRKAKADRAVLDQPRNLINLTGSARVWDPTGSADADKIVMDQKSGDFTADGNVSSTRMPDKKDPPDKTAKQEKPDSKVNAKDKSKDTAKDSSSGGMLQQDEPLHARAKKMVATDHNLQIRYEGNAVLWQSANRLTADIVEIDRDNDVLKAHGHVVSQLIDKQDDKDPKKVQKAKEQGSIFTIVKAPELVYDDDERIAHYKGGCTLERPDMKVKSQEIRAFLRDSDKDSSLDHAFAEGNVEIVRSAPGRTRTGTSEHAEYYVDQDKVLLSGGQPQFVDSVKGTTRGKELIWYSKDDRLLVNGAEGQPATSKLRRK